METRTWHSGHLYVGGKHYIHDCPTCTALVAKADAIAAATKEDQQ